MAALIHALHVGEVELLLQFLPLLIVQLDILLFVFVQQPDSL